MPGEPAVVGLLERAARLIIELQRRHPDDAREADLLALGGPPCTSDDV
jgi:hypothetical protein